MHPRASLRLCKQFDISFTLVLLVVVVVVVVAVVVV